MRAAAGAVGERFRHEAGEGAVLAGDLVGHHAEVHQTVRHIEGIGEHEVGFELAVGVFVVEGIHVPTLFVHGVHDLVDDRQVVHQHAGVVTGLVEHVAVADRREAAVLGILEQKELGFDTQVETEAQLGGGRQLALENMPGAGLERLAVKVQVAGEPGELTVPGALGGACRVGHRRHFVVVDVLGHTVQGGAGVQFRTLHHAVQVVERHELALNGAVDIHVAGHGVLHAFFRQILAQGFNGLVRIHRFLSCRFRRWALRVRLGTIPSFNIHASLYI